MIKQVKKEAQKYTKYQTIIAAINGVESSNGENKHKIGDDGASYGDMQIQVPTVRQVAKWWPEHLAWTEKLSDLDIAKLLLTRLDFSVQVASLYFEHYLKHWGFTKAVMAYNGLPGGKMNWKYFNKVMRYKDLINKELR